MSKRLPFLSSFSDLRLPLIVSPMFIVSGTELTVASCVEGIVGTFPALNGRSHEDFLKMLNDTETALKEFHAKNPTKTVAPYGVNLIVHKSNPRLLPDLQACVDYEVPLIITSLGNPKDVIEAVHSYDGKVFSDVATIEHAKKAASVGVDGLILVCAGAGGHAGELSPFAFVPAVRAFFNGTIIVAGCISHGQSVRAVEILGGDFAYSGTRFIPTKESHAQDEYKTMVVESTAADIIHTPAVSGTPANFMRQSLIKSGYDLTVEHVRRPMSLGDEAKAWKDTWSAGQGVEGIQSIQTVAEVVAQMEKEYRSTFSK